jgi:hypothetical protein
LLNENRLLVHDASRRKREEAEEVKYTI